MLIKLHNANSTSLKTTPAATTTRASRMRIASPVLILAFSFKILAIIVPAPAEDSPLKINPKPMPTKTPP